MSDVIEEKIVEAPKTPITALEAITAERARQDAKWGEQNHDGMKWVLITTEELGELAESLLKEDRANYITELTQLAAVTLAWLECEYRRTVVEADGAPVKRESGLLQWNGIVSMERDETKGSQSPMWRCLTADGEKVNVFKHADPKRDTFQLFNAAGYGATMLSMEVGQVWSWKEHPVKVRLKMENSWWSVTEVDKMPLDAKPEIGRDDAKAKAEAAAWAKALLESDDWVVVDTETTGLDRELDQPVSITIIDSKGDILLNTLVKPTIEIDAEATAIHGIDAEKLKDAPAFADLHDKLHSILGRKKIVGYNARFDNDMLINAARASNVKPMLYGGSTDCAMLNYAKFYGEWNPHHADYKNQSLSKACEQQEIPDFAAPAHSALGDCLRTLALIKKMAAHDPHPF